MPQAHYNEHFNLTAGSFGATFNKGIFSARNVSIVTGMEVDRTIVPITVGMGSSQALDYNMDL